MHKVVCSGDGGEGFSAVSLYHVFIKHLLTDLGGINNFHSFRQTQLAVEVGSPAVDKTFVFIVDSPNS